MSVTPTLEELAATVAAHTNTIADMAPTVQSASDSIDELNRLAQFNANLPVQIPTSGSSSTSSVTNSTTINGVGFTFVTQSLIFSVSTSALAWTTYTLPGTVPVGATGILVTYQIQAGTINTRPSSSSALTILVGSESGATTTGGMCAVVPILNGQVQFEVLGAAPSATVNLVGYWAAP